MDKLAQLQRLCRQGGMPEPGWLEPLSRSVVLYLLTCALVQVHLPILVCTLRLQQSQPEAAQVQGSKRKKRFKLQFPEERYLHSYHSRHPQVSPKPPLLAQQRRVEPIASKGTCGLTGRCRLGYSRLI